MDAQKIFAARLWFGAVLLLSSNAARAHSFTVEYTLPLPFPLYAAGAAAALVLSFFAFGLPTNAGSSLAPADRGFHAQVMRVPVILTRSLQTISLASMTLAVACGFFGTSDPFDNFSMTYFWIWIVLGVAYLSIAFADIQLLINPWLALCNLLQSFGLVSFRARLVYPARLDRYPALLMYATFVWLELFAHMRPQGLSVCLVTYSLLNVAGAWAFGRSVWFRDVEFFGVLFGFFGSLSPIKFSLIAGDDATVRFGVSMRREVFRVDSETTLRWSSCLFVVFMLSSTAFDGLQSTVEGYSVLSDLSARSATAEGRLGLGAQSFVLFSLPFLYLLILFVTLVVSRSIAGSALMSSELVRRFVPTLIPIAIAYHFAHYYTSFVGQASQIVRLASDPFGVGWDLFGTASMTRAPFLIDIETVWNTQLGVILLGHVVAVYWAHGLARRVFSSRSNLLWHQMPMLVLMVAMTVFGLWILSLQIQGPI
jgi:hypothetical protein